MAKISIIIPSIGREKELQNLKKLIEEQTFQDYEVIVCNEEGSLAEIRNYGARRASGEILVFVDDDIEPIRTWLHSIVCAFRNDRHICGVSGPTVIRPKFRSQRDLFRHRGIKRIYDLLFVGEARRHAGRISKAGTFSTRACDEDCMDEGPVDYLEACNMAWKASAFWTVGGFDESYKGVGDWSEPDLAFRLRKMGGTLWFTRNAKVYHNPSRSGAFKKRKADAWQRYKNYLRFSDKWIKPSFKNRLFKIFLWSYYVIKTIK